ncbi:MAG: DUF1345 domain-containing protein [Ruminococcus sp.]|nr:DUF1345 domain-containing protein [Ruminococcus sp.]
MKKVQNALMQSFLKARLEMLRLQQEEDGAEMVETVILVGVAAIIGVIVLALLTGDNHDGEGGILGTIFEKVRGKIEDLFN